MVLYNYNSLHGRSFDFATLLIASKCRLFVGTAAHLANPIILMVDSVPWYEKYCLWGSDQNQWGSMTCACNNKDLIPPNNDVKVCKKTWVRSVQSELSTAWFISWAGEFDKLQCCNCGEMECQIAGEVVIGHRLDPSHFSCQFCWKCYTDIIYKLRTLN